jgi:hypothetical protein
MLYNVGYYVKKDNSYKYCVGGTDILVKCGGRVKRVYISFTQKTDSISTMLQREELSLYLAHWATKPCFIGSLLTQRVECMNVRIIVANDEIPIRR